MSRKDNCWDNAVTETLFGSLKVERMHGERFETIRQAKDAVLDRLLWYNRKRMHSTLNYASPIRACFDRLSSTCFQTLTAEQAHFDLGLVEPTAMFTPIRLRPARES